MIIMLRSTECSDNSNDYENDGKFDDEKIKEITTDNTDVQNSKGTKCKRQQ
jgi:hypothetical protein